MKLFPQNFPMRSRFNSLICAGLLLGVISCGSSETTSDQDIKKEALVGTRPDGSDSKVYGWFRVQFDAETQSLESSMEIRLDGESGNGIKLTAPNRLELNGDTAVESSGKSGIYTSTYKVQKSVEKPETNYVVKWFQENVVRVNSVKMPSAFSIEGLDNAVADRNKDLEIKWNGAELSPGQKMEVWIDSSNSSSEGKETAWFTTVTAGKSVFMPSAEVKIFQKGSASVRLTKKFSEPLNQGFGKGGTLDASYIAKRATVLFPD